MYGWSHVIIEVYHIAIYVGKYHMYVNKWLAHTGKNSKSIPSVITNLGVDPKIFGWELWGLYAVPAYKDMAD